MELSGKKIAFLTLGCKLNFAESSAIGRALTAAGCVRAAAGEKADICIVNTCSVTDTADHKDRQAIHRIATQNPNAFVVVTGCYAQLKPNEVASLPDVDLVLGANEKIDLEAFLQKFDAKSAKINAVKTAKIRSFKPICSADDRTRHFLKVQDGCDYYCTYCTIPFARGRSRNATIAETVSVARQAIADGAKEIVLTGVNTGDFGRSTGETFFDLVRALDQLDGARYRISSIEPNLLTDEIIAYVAQSPHFAPHFHLPLQSGSDQVLKLMHRRYNTAFFAAKVAEIKRLMPNAFIGIDVMVGVRGETPEYFAATCDFLEKLPCSQLHVFTYSERAGTKALEIDYTVPHAERKRRNDILRQLSDKKLKDFYASQCGNEALVLWEAAKRGGMMHGFTENYVRLQTPYDKAKVNTVERIVISKENLSE